jgi:hypothetical protein
MKDDDIVKIANSIESYMSRRENVGKFPSLMTLL